MQTQFTPIVPHKEPTVTKTNRADRRRERYHTDAAYRTRQVQYAKNSYDKHKKKARKGYDPESFKVRFWAKVSIPGILSCWEWTATTCGKGYGSIAIRVGLNKYRKIMTHRLSWEMHFGNIPEGMCVLHKCDNPPCVNPAHLFLGTKSDNGRDMARKGRSTYGEKNPLSKLTDDQVIVIRKRVLEGEVQRQIARELDVSASTISLIVKRETWKHLL